MKLSDSLMPLFAYVRLFLQSPRGDVAEVAQRIDALIENARNHAVRIGTTNSDFDDALFAVCAWTDETLLNSGWDDADCWTQQLLQKRHFDTSHAGVEFFERIDHLDGARGNVLEIYLFCVKLGFRGRYGYDDNRQPLDEIQRRASEILSADVPMPAEGESPFPAAYACTDPCDAAARALARRRRLKLTSLNFGVPLATLLSLYLIYHIIILTMVNSALPKLQ
ncbi:type VI secretion system protein ImpK [Burkholderia cepacia]|uniref:Type VI secretion system protein ImpK n=1 Tax=Burkholderia cepacia TaxID=292 RepID=A0A0J5WQ42_BURCE|nr:DotU family type IV/VI secretion system protein [Burkholderia cepacia]KML54616.1 type VI secretion system protein ImpK [Burkholderia cepacia]